MIWTLMKVYFLIGVVLILCEAVILRMVNGRWLEGDATIDRIAEVTAYIFEVVIWPVGLWQAINSMIRAYRGELTDEEYECLMRGYAAGVRFREKVGRLLKGGD